MVITQINLFLSYDKPKFERCIILVFELGMELEVYHTTENRGNHEEIITDGGIYAFDNDLFLGRGHYYWEGNFDQAKTWGKRYNNNYCIFNGILIVELELLLDFTYNTHIKRFKELQQNFKKKHLPIGIFIDFVRDYQNELLEKGEITKDELFFPFLYSRAIDSTLKPTTRIRFANHTTETIDGQPIVIVCVYKKNDLVLKEFRLVKSYGEVQPNRSRNGKHLGQSHK